MGSFTLSLSQSLSGLPAFLVYFATSLALLALFAVVYGRITPYREHTLIREGNVAAAISLAGALIGFVLPLASAVAHSVNLLDMLVWALIALVAQIIVYVVVGRIVPHFAQAIEAGKVAPATLLAAIAVVVGLLNAAALTY